MPPIVTHMAKWIITAILLLPLAEIVAFILVAALVGLGVAFLLMLATTLAGFVVLRRAGRGGIARFRVAVADTDVAGIQANTSGFLTVLAGLLLFLPGFLTDLVGAALLIGPVRRWCSRTFRHWVRRRDPAERATIDLAPGDWQHLPERELPNKPDRRD
jgi:UPF0716 protein FxsA